MEGPTTLTVAEVGWVVIDTSATSMAIMVKEDEGAIKN